MISSIDEECSEATLIGVSALLRIVYLSFDYRTILYRLLGGLRRELGAVDELEDYRSDYRFVTCIGLPNDGLPLSAARVLLRSGVLGVSLEQAVSPRRTAPRSMKICFSFIISMGL